MKSRSERHFEFDHSSGYCGSRCGDIAIDCENRVGFEGSFDKAIEVAKFENAMVKELVVSALGGYDINSEMEIIVEASKAGVVIADSGVP